MSRASPRLLLSLRSATLIAAVSAFGVRSLAMLPADMAFVIIAAIAARAGRAFLPGVPAAASTTSADDCTGTWLPRALKTRARACARRTPSTPRPPTPRAPPPHFSPLSQPPARRARFRPRAWAPCRRRRWWFCDSRVRLLVRTGGCPHCAVPHGPGAWGRARARGAGAAEPGPRHGGMGHHGAERDAARLRLLPVRARVCVSEGELEGGRAVREGGREGEKEGGRG